ncbi:MAG: NTP transferase domain-containing protein [Clostridia bacterium]|nr:NTP transferase domain-containing protein [Clostridia bacterium]
MMNAAAIILCAGKGTRMEDDSKNKVCFDCAGIPTIKRIIGNMREAGVSRFVIVIGHSAYSVMDTLDGEEGVIYAYQKEQKGTGHATMCGLKALQTVGYTGSVIVSMGDKIIATHVICDILKKAETTKAVWGVQPIEANFNGGRVVTIDETPCGVVEFADAALMKLGEVSKEEYVQTLKKIRLNPKKAEKVLKKALANKPKATITLCGRRFTADEVLGSKYANAGLYCFDVTRAVEIIKTLGNNNAQGEIYLTDTLEKFATANEATIHVVASAEDMLTYSTKTELRDISKYFMRTASQFIADIQNGGLDQNFTSLYREQAEEQKDRYIRLLKFFIEKCGDQKIVITRSPGRINLMGRHIDHRGGGINVMATDKDIVFVSASRTDDEIRIANIDSAFPEKSFSIAKTLGEKKYAKWLDYLADERVVLELKESNGCWSNYVKSAVIKAQFETETAICGMDMVASGTIPMAAGLSSSSSIVVAVMEAVVALNGLSLSNKEFINLCGEGEWFVGSRGGAGDHAAMKCGEANRIVHLSFKPFEVGESASFSDKYAVIVANSMLKAKKSEGSKDKFNAKVAAYEFAFMLIKRLFPDCGFIEFRDIAKVRPYSEIYKMLKAIPETVTRGAILALLPEYKDRIKQIFATHVAPEVYELRGVALYGISECVRADRCMQLLNEGKYQELGEMMKISHNGDRVGGAKITDELLDELAKQNEDVALQCGAYDCSTQQIDYLCDVLNDTDGVLGSEIVGAGLGGCVVALVEKVKANVVIEVINEKYYDKYGYEHGAHVYSASHGSFVWF